MPISIYSFKIIIYSGKCNIKNIDIFFYLAEMIINPELFFFELHLSPSLKNIPHFSVSQLSGFTPTCAMKVYSFYTKNNRGNEEIRDRILSRKIFRNGRLLTESREPSSETS